MIKVLLLLPIAFLAGMDGFLFFAPYALFCMVLVYIVRRRSRARRLAKLQQARSARQYSLPDLAIVTALNAKATVASQAR